MKVLVMAMTANYIIEAVDCNGVYRIDPLHFVYVICVCICIKVGAMSIIFSREGCATTTLWPCSL
jgi:hypothetical protein